MSDEAKRTGIRSLFSRMNGVALSIALHVVLALVAAVSAISVNASGGSDAGGSRGAGGAWKFPATLRNPDETVISGTPLGDPAQYGRLSSEETAPEPILDEAPALIFPAEIPAGASDPLPPPPAPSRPGARDGRSRRLPAPAGD